MKHLSKVLTGLSLASALIVLLALIAIIWSAFSASPPDIYVKPVFVMDSEWCDRKQIDQQRLEPYAIHQSDNSEPGANQHSLGEVKTKSAQVAKETGSINSRNTLQAQRNGPEECFALIANSSNLTQPGQSEQLSEEHKYSKYKNFLAEPMSALNAPNRSDNFSTPASHVESSLSMTLGIVTVVIALLSLIFALLSTKGADLYRKLDIKFDNASELLKKLEGRHSRLLDWMMREAELDNQHYLIELEHCNFVAANDGIGRFSAKTEISMILDNIQKSVQEDVLDASATKLIQLVSSNEARKHIIKFLQMLAQSLNTASPEYEMSNSDEPFEQLYQRRLKRARLDELIKRASDDWALTTTPENGG